MSGGLIECRGGGGELGRGLEERGGGGGRGENQKGELED